MLRRLAAGAAGPLLHAAPTCAGAGVQLQLAPPGTLWPAQLSTAGGGVPPHLRGFGGTGAPAACGSSGGGGAQRAATPSLRSELGGGAALGSPDAPGGGDQQSDTARRRQSLLSGSGRFYETVVVAPYGQQQQQQQRAGDSAASGSSAGSGGGERGSGPPGSGWQLLLRKHAIKTPAKHLLVLPTRSLALAVAAEWEWLPRGRPQPHLMPLMSLAATAIDQPKERPKVIEHLLKYVHTDSACVRYEPGPLERRQAATFDPLLSWAERRLGWALAPSHSICGTTQPDATVAAVEAWLGGLDRWHLAAAEQLVTSTKSVVVAAALLGGRLSVREAVRAARLEEDYQLEEWGMVEAGHDLDIADANTRVAAPSVFVRLLSLP